jgi:phosphoribosylglycinamide formyltransferase-1
MTPADAARGADVEVGAGPGASDRRSAGNNEPSAVVVLARDNEATAILVNYLSPLFDRVVTVVEEPQSRLVLARRRARRLGWVPVAGQLAFAALAVPVLNRRARSRLVAIGSEAHVDTSPISYARQVESVNSPECITFLQELQPVAVVVLGTRIISSTVLDAVGCPFVNLHAGIAPHYRGMHGNYWAVTEGRRDRLGATVHLIDSGIDTGTVLAHAYFTPQTDDSVVTYPCLSLVVGLPTLAQQVRRLVEGEPAEPTPESSDVGSHLGPTDPGAPGPASESRLWWSPTLWGYLKRRLVNGVR